MTVSATEVARMLIDRHGLRAGAVAQEHINEAQLGGDTAAHNHWSCVSVAVSELRRTAPKDAAASMA
jgi:hypothetical protein